GPWRTRGTGRTGSGPDLPARWRTGEGNRARDRLDVAPVDDARRRPYFPVRPCPPGTAPANGNCPMTSNSSLTEMFRRSVARIVPLFGFSSSKDYWERRYRLGGNSGA